ncbi:MAG: hypothetical protein ACFBZ8_02055 [Opitutales bacterium]
MKGFVRLLRANELFLQLWTTGTSVVTVTVYRDLAPEMSALEAGLRSLFISTISVGVCLLGFSVLVFRVRQFWSLWHPLSKPPHS